MVMNAITMARAAARKALEATHEGRCTISQYQLAEDPNTFISEQKDVLVYKDLPCRLSYSSSPATGLSETADSISQNIKLFLAPDISVAAGSKITVSQNGCTIAYKQSGQPAVYATHQEINLELYEEHP